MADVSLARPLGAIPFGRSAVLGRELQYIAEAVVDRGLAGGGKFMHRCQLWLEGYLAARRVLLTHSCTAALEMAAMLAEVGPGDEVIMPSFTFSATATAFALRGATPVFIDIRPDTLNLDERLIEPAITSRTRAVVPVHYAGLPCEMDTICAVAADRALVVIEDAAMGLGSDYKGRSLGTIGQFGCLSFHATKNVISGEGGALIVNEERFVERAEIIREKGTDRNRFLRGEVDKYSWQDIGSSYCPGEIISAFLYAQLECAEQISARRRSVYNSYKQGFQNLANRGHIAVPRASGAECNGHLFWILLRDEAERASLIRWLSDHGIGSAFHYVPLHSAPAGRRFGRAMGELAVTQRISSTLLRLPLHFEMTDDQVARVIETVSAYFARK